MSVVAAHRMLLRSGHARHDLLDRRRHNPRRTAIGAGFFSWLPTIVVAGTGDRLLVSVVTRTRARSTSYGSRRS